MTKAPTSGQKVVWSSVYLSSKDFIVNKMLGANGISITPVEVELLQFILAVQRSTLHICPSTIQHNLVTSAHTSLDLYKYICLCKQQLPKRMGRK